MEMLDNMERRDRKMSWGDRLEKKTEQDKVLELWKENGQVQVFPFVLFVENCNTIDGFLVLFNNYVSLRDLLEH